MFNINIITHKKNLNALLNLLNNCVSAISAPQILSLKGECTFLLLNFPRISLCNYFATSFLKIFSFLVPLPGVSLPKNFLNYWRPLWYPSCFGSEQY